MVRAITVIVPVRHDPSEESEQETQLLYGELCTVLDELPRWLKIQSEQDGSIGWVDRKMMWPADCPLPEIRREKMTMGTRLPNGIVLDATTTLSAPLPLNHDNVMNLVNMLLDTPYLWGGKSIGGMDCSGMTQVMMSLFGVDLPRNASQQIKCGIPVDALNLSQIGDLVFFDHADQSPERTAISHVGMLLSPTKLVHCSGSVHIDDIDDMGIINVLGKRTHHLVAIRRMQLNNK